MLEAAALGVKNECEREDFYDDMYSIASNESQYDCHTTWNCTCSHCSARFRLHTVIQCFYIVCYPIIALVTFGPSAVVQKRLAWLAGVLNTSRESRSNVSDTIHSTPMSGGHQRQHSASAAIQMKVMKAYSKDRSSASREPSATPSCAEDQTSRKSADSSWFVASDA